MQSWNEAGVLRWPSFASLGQFRAGREAQGNFFARSHRKVNGCLTNGLRVETRQVQGHRRLFRKTDEHSRAINRVWEKEPFGDDRLVRDALSSVVDESALAIRHSPFEITLERRVRPCLRPPFFPQKLHPRNPQFPRKESGSFPLSNGERSPCRKNQIRLAAAR